MGESKKLDPLNVIRFSVVLVAWLVMMANLRSDRGWYSYSLDVLAYDGDTASLARDLLSPALLDAALKTEQREANSQTLPLAKHARFASASDPRAALRGLLTVTTDPASRTVRLSMVAHSISEGHAVLNAIRDATLKVWGPARAAPRRPNMALGTSLSFSSLAILAMVVTSSIGVATSFHMRRRKAGEQGTGKRRLTVAGLMFVVVMIAVMLAIPRLMSGMFDSSDRLIDPRFDDVAFAFRFGNDVVIKKHDVPLMAEGRVVPESNRFRTYRVTDVAGETLNVWANRDKGELKIGDIIDIAHADEFFTEQITRNPKSAEAYARRAAVSEAKGMVDDAFADLKTALEIAPKDASIWRYRAELRMKRNDFDGAISDFTAAIIHQPNDAHAYFLRSWLWAKKGAENKRLADLSEAIRCDPQWKEPYWNRGLVLADRNELDRALADFDAAIRIDPTFGSAYQYRGNVWRAKGNVKLALADYSEAIRLEPEKSFAYIERANLYTQQKEYGKALEDIDRALQIYPGYSHAYETRGKIRFARQEYFDAIQDFDRAIKRNPKSATAFIYRGSAWSKREEFANAIADYEAASKLAPEAPWPRNELAWIRATCPDPPFRDGKQAVALAMEACKLTAWQNGTYLDTLAAALAETGDFDKAIERQKAANALFTDPVTRAAGEARLKNYREKTPYRDKRRRK